MAELGSDKKQTFEDGELFIDFDKKLNLLFYLENLPKLDKKGAIIEKECNLVKCKLNEDL